MSDEAPSGVAGKWVLAGFVALLVVVATAVILIARDVDDKAKKAQELESRLGRQVGPEDSPKHQKKLQKQREQKAGE